MLKVGLFLGGNQLIILSLELGDCVLKINKLGSVIGVLGLELES